MIWPRKSHTVTAIALHWLRQSQRSAQIQGEGHRARHWEDCQYHTVRTCGMRGIVAAHLENTAGYGDHAHLEYWANGADFPWYRREGKDSRE